MPNTTAGDLVESVFDRNQRREAEINDALKQEQARHEAVVKNMQRLKALRLSQDQKQAKLASHASQRGTA
jgi:hypothetical protein